MSRKLDGNGRWESSRMMLPEHREAYLKKRRHAAAEGGTAGGVPLPTKEELELIRDCVLLPMMLTIADKNCADVRRSASSMKRLYVRACEALMKLMHDDLARARKELRSRNIKLYPEERVDSAVRYRFNCRGYEDEFGMMRDVVRAEISMKFARYIGMLFK